MMERLPHATDGSQTHEASSFSHPVPQQQTEAIEKFPDVCAVSVTDEALTVHPHSQSNLDNEDENNRQTSLHTIRPSSYVRVGTSIRANSSLDVMNIPSKSSDEFLNDFRCASLIDVSHHTSLSPCSTDSQSVFEQAEADGNPPLTVHENTTIANVTGWRVHPSGKQTHKEKRVTVLSALADYIAGFTQTHYKDRFAGQPHKLFMGLCGHDPFVICLQQEKSTTHFRVLMWQKEGVSYFLMPAGALRSRTLLGNSNTLKALGKYITKDRQLQNSIMSFTRIRTSEKVEETMLKIEEEHFKTYNPKTIKVGLLYAAGNDVSEAGLLNPADESDTYQDFLLFLGEWVELKDWKRFGGGLDTRNNKNGSHSVFTKADSGQEIMFHVCTMMKARDKDKQRVDIKRHIGNDACVVLFRDLNSTAPFDPDTFRTQFTQTYVVVQVIREGPEPLFRINVTAKAHIPFFNPHTPDNIFSLGPHLRCFLYDKLINASIYAKYAPQFFNPMCNYRAGLLRDLVEKSRSVASPSSIS